MWQPRRVRPDVLDRARGVPRRRGGFGGAAAGVFDGLNGCPAPVVQTECTDDPFCPPDACVLPSPPQRIDYCFCEPLGVSVDCCCVPDIAANRDETYRVVIDAGKNPNDANFTARGMRNARVLFYQHDPKRPCPSDDEVAAGLWTINDACAVLEIPFLRPGSQVIIDGRTERITVECDSRCYPGWQNGFGGGGAGPGPVVRAGAG